MAGFGFVVVVLITVYSAFRNFERRDVLKIYVLALTVFPATCLVFAYAKGRENPVWAIIYVCCAIAIAGYAHYLKRKTSA